MPKEPLKPLANKYYIATDKEKTGKITYLHEPDAKPIELREFEGIDMFIVKEMRATGSFWRISEGYGGFQLYLSFEAESKPDAIQNALAELKIKKRDKEIVKAKINEKVKQWGMCPRYK